MLGMYALNNYVLIIQGLILTWIHSLFVFVHLNGFKSAPRLVSVFVGVHMLVLDQHVELELSVCHGFITV